MAIHICNDTVECIIRIIDFLRKVKHVRPTAEKIYTPIKKELNDELDIAKNKTNIDYLINTMLRNQRRRRAGVGVYCRTERGKFGRIM